MKTRKQLLAEIKDLNIEIRELREEKSRLYYKNSDLRQFLQIKIDWFQNLVNDGKTPRLVCMIEDFTRAHERNK